MCSSSPQLGNDHKPASGYLCPYDRELATRFGLSVSNHQLNYQHYERRLPLRPLLNCGGRKVAIPAVPAVIHY